MASSLEKSKSNKEALVMIRFIFDLKIGTGEDFYLVSKNERIEHDVDEDEFENFSSMNQEELVKYLLDSLDMMHDYIEEFFSDYLIHDRSFIDKVDILDISNVRIKKIGKSSKRSSSMKAAEVMKLLNITRPTLCKYVKEGKIKTDACVNGQYRYNKESVYALIKSK